MTAIVWLWFSVCVCPRRSSKIDKLLSPTGLGWLILYLYQIYRGSMLIFMLLNIKETRDK